MSKWYLPDMYWPTASTGDEYVSHEAICVLNPASEPCRILITLYFENREPVELKPYTCQPRRTMHIRIDAAKDSSGLSVPRGEPYAAVIECSVSETVVQYTRVDTTQPALALMTTMAHPLGN